MVASTAALLGVSNVAQRFGVSRETVLSWVEADELIAIDTARAGSKRRFLKFTNEAIEDFQKLRETGKPKFPRESSRHVHEFF